MSDERVFYNHDLWELELEALASHRVDGRFAPMVATWHAADVRIVRDYLRNPSKATLAQATHEPFTVVVTRFATKLYIHDGDTSHPAPGGLWMDQWDEDTEVFSGITAAAYSRFPVGQRAQAEARTQAMRYAATEYRVLKARFWQRAAYEHWYWDEGGCKRDYVSSSNDYWRSRLSLEP